ncbi:hypothetical protein [Acidithiobacillus sp.]|uniref:hypothetical protein n=1 Tax=Acidithiobacillus sp. TaxID=1872118 RepID=UPI0026050703|nr:hypothetical protein [Acidithiobacillus sp.]MDD5280939.1 hypothetical protein [Acidithiobacillus sp.]
MTARRPYEELTDLEKVQKQWHKLSGLHTREEWSAAIVRAATAAEIAANFAIRREFELKSDFDSKFVDSLLRWANGLAGKLDRLLIPLSKTDETKNEKIITLKAVAGEIHTKRNAITHQGEFCKKEEAMTVIAKAEQFILTLVQIYDPKFFLKSRSPINSSTRHSSRKKKDV